MMRGRVDPKKEEQEKLQGFLLDMLKEEENKYCADCQAKTPRWAAWNLGIYICIRCAGIHRNLGVHISKVRSVNLDSWTPEQVQTMRVMGNEKARQVYEHSLPPQFRRPTSDNQMEQFIRSKYEQKRYMVQNWTYPRVDVNDLPKSLAPAPKKGPNPVVSISTRGATAAVMNNNANSSGTVNDLLDFSAPASKTSSNSQCTTGSLIDDLNGLTLSTNTSSVSPAAPTASSNDDFDDFGSFVSASANNNATTTNNSNSFAAFADFSAAPTVTPAAPAPVATSNLEELTFPPPEAIDQKKSNADILSLFSSSGTPCNAPNVVAPGGFAGFGLQAAQVQQTQNNHQNNTFAAFGSTPATVAPQNDLYGGLGGINFGAPTPAPPQNFNSVFPPMQQQQHNHNQFGGFGQVPMSGMAKQTPTSPTGGSQGFSIPNKSNAFADLALGKVMKTNYGQSALHTPPTQPMSNSNRVSPAPQLFSSTQNQPASTPSSINNDLFDMFSTAPPPVTVNSSSGLDDLLGL